MNGTIHKTGYVSSGAAFAATSLFVIAQTLQLIHVLHFPWDATLIYSFSLLITLPYLLAILSLHYMTATHKRIWSHAAILFSMLYVVFVVANYVVQLGVVIPATLRGEATSVALLDQTPQSVFWYFDAVGYIAMGITAFFVFLALDAEGIQKTARLWFLLHSLTTPIIAWVYISPHFSNQLLLLAVPWAITALASTLSLAMLFKHGIGHASNNQTI